jgi:hypothetical protein
VGSDHNQKEMKLIKIIECSDIFKTLLYDWIEFRDIINLDTALANHELRQTFFNLLKAIPYKLSSRSKYSLDTSLGWFIKRNMYNLLGEIDANASAWNKIMSFPNINRPSFLNSLVKLTLRYQDKPYAGLDQCIHLQQLSCFFFNSRISLPPNLTTISFFHGSLNEDILISLNACSRLRHFSWEGNVIYPLKAATQHQHQHFQFFQSVQSLTIKGKIFSFLKIYSNIPNHFEIIHFDNMHGPPLYDSPNFLNQFFQNSSHLHSLELAQTMFIISDFFHALLKCSTSPFLKKLVLYRCGYGGFDDLREEMITEVSAFPRRIKSLTIDQITPMGGSVSDFTETKLKILTYILRWMNPGLTSIHLSLNADGATVDYLRGLVHRYCPDIKEAVVRL